MNGIQSPKRSDRLLQLSRSTTASLAALTSAGAAGCGRAPSFNILGSFFPAWLICMVVGIVLAAIAHWVLTHYKLGKEISWPVLVYPCLAEFFAFTLWLVFFS
jgi:hypothetical protein